MTTVRHLISTYEKPKPMNQNELWHITKTVQQKTIQIASEYEGKMVTLIKR